MRIALALVVAAGCSTPARQPPPPTPATPATSTPPTSSDVATPAVAAAAVATPAVDATPWEALDAWVVDEGLIVTRDARKQQTRLTAFDLATGAEVAHRVFDVPAGVVCEASFERTLLCEIEDGDLRVIDTTTLEDRIDVDALVRELAPDSDPARWELMDGQLVRVDATRGVRVDLDDRTAMSLRPVKAMKSAGARCWAPPAKEPVVVDGQKWTVDAAGDGSTLRRRKGRKQLPAIELDLARARIVGCGYQHARPFLISNDADKIAHVVAALGSDGSVTWTSESLGGHVGVIMEVGDALIVPTGNQARRVVALDARTGAIRWTATGPQPE